MDRVGFFTTDDSSFILDGIHERDHPWRCGVGLRNFFVVPMPQSAVVAVADRGLVSSAKALTDSYVDVTFRYLGFRRHYP